MRFLHIKLMSLPIIKYAHGYQTSEYHMLFGGNPEVMEICQYEIGNVIKKFPDGDHLEIPTHSLCALPYDGDYEITCYESTHQHFSVGFTADYTYEYIDSKSVTLSYFDKKSSGIPLEFYLPESIPLDTGNSVSEQILRKIIRVYTENGGHSDVACVSALLELFSQLSSDCIACSASPDYEREKPFSSSLYTRRATQYIAANINYKITVSEIAQYLGISAEHLSKQFHSVTGTTVIEYINKMKLGIVKDLIIANDMSLREAGENVGITDVNYLSRLFKRYIGITASEYKILNKTYCSD